MSGISSVQNYYANVLHNPKKATSRHERDASEGKGELIAAAEKARARKSEKEKETGAENEVEAVTAYEQAQAQFPGRKVTKLNEEHLGLLREQGSF